MLKQHALRQNFAYNPQLKGNVCLHRRHAKPTQALLSDRLNSCYKGFCGFTGARVLGR
ncbi:hypothetical protein [Phormidesmis priestleyi]